MNIHFCYDVAARKRAEKMLEHSDPNKKVFTIWGITTVIDSTIPIYDGVYLNLVDFKVYYPTAKQIDKVKKRLRGRIIKINDKPIKISDVIKIFKQQEEGLVNIRLVDLSNRKLGKIDEETFNGMFDDDFGKGEI